MNGCQVNCRGWREIFAAASQESLELAATGPPPPPPPPLHAPPPPQISSSNAPPGSPISSQASPVQGGEKIVHCLAIDCPPPRFWESMQGGTDVVGMGSSGYITSSNSSNRWHPLRLHTTVHSKKHAKGRGRVLVYKDKASPHLSHLIL